MAAVGVLYVAVDNGLSEVCVWQSALSHLFCGARLCEFCVVCCVA